MADKQYFANVKLMGGSVVKDEAGKQISLTATERDGISGAYGGPLSASNPVVSKTQHDQDINGLRAGLRWRDPVDTVSDTAPATPTEGARYINTTDKKLYTYTEGAWSSETPLANWTVFAKDTDEEWTYDEEGAKWVMKSSGSIPYATTTMPGKVQLATALEVSSTKAVTADDPRLGYLKGSYSTTLTNPTGTITVTHNLGTPKFLIQAWSAGEQVEVQVTRTVADINNKIDVSVNGTPSSVDIYIVALP